MGDFQKLSGSAYSQTKGRMEPEKEREPIQTSSTAAEIRRMQEQGGSDEQVAASGPYPSTAATGASTPDAPPPDLGMKDFSVTGADDVVAGSTDFAFTPATKPGAETVVSQPGNQANQPGNQDNQPGNQDQPVTERNARNNA